MARPEGTPSDRQVLGGVADPRRGAPRVDSADSCRCCHRPAAPHSFLCAPPASWLGLARGGAGRSRSFDRCDARVAGPSSAPWSASTTSSARAMTRPWSWSDGPLGTVDSEPSGSMLPIFSSRWSDGPLRTVDGVIAAFRNSTGPAVDAAAVDDGGPDHRSLGSRAEVSPSVQQHRPRSTSDVHDPSLRSSG